jgi:hypothetical protein
VTDASAGPTLPAAATPSSPPDPVRTVEAVYAAFGLPLTGPARAAMKAVQARCAGRCGPAHRYALSDFGLTDRQVGERFAGYR